ncbi:MAG TPA: DUF6496 domain-containing protein [Bryobacteraceae bacterium]|nr:DUF6496 domain-containing protein [Bryobacteraceae bacterium]
MATKKSSTSKASSKGKGKVKKVMHEFKQGELKSGGSGRKVKGRKQAVAIALSEAREAGASIPKKGAAKKKATKKTTAKRSTAKKSTAKKSTAKKTTAKKSASKRRL